MLVCANAIGEWFKRFVSTWPGFSEHPLDMGAQFLFSPPIAGGQLGAVGVPVVRAVEQRPGGSCVVAGVRARRQAIAPLGPPGVLFYECTGHASVRASVELERAFS